MPFDAAKRDWLGKESITIPQTAADSLSKRQATKGGPIAQNAGFGTTGAKVRDGETVKMDS